MLSRILNINSLFLLILLSLCFLVFFNGLGDYSVRKWDESRNGINALEMMRSGQLVVTTFNNSPDLWNTKPPLLIWIIAGLFKIFGVSEFALRFPSALAATLTVSAMYLFAARILQSKLIGFLSGLIILSAFGFSDIHIGRSGDYDALLTLLTFVGSCFYYIYLHKYQQKFLSLSILFFTLAVLTKGIAGVFIVPAIIIFSLIFGDRAKTIFSFSFWKIHLIGFGVVCAYYLGRELINHGYLTAVWNNEIFGRSLQSNEEGRQSELLYYWQWLVNFRYQYWTYLVPFTFITFFITKSVIIKKWVIFSFLIVISYYFIISVSQTKYLWYDAQLYPFASLLIAALLITAMRRIPYALWLIPALILTFYTQRFIRTNLAYINRPDLEKTDSCYKYGYWFREKDNPQSGYIATHHQPEYCMPFYFYMTQYQIPVKPVDSLSVGDRVLSCDTVIVDQIINRFSTTQLHKDDQGCTVLELKTLK